MTRVLRWQKPFRKCRRGAPGARGRRAMAHGGVGAALARRAAALVRRRPGQPGPGPARGVVAGSKPPHQVRPPPPRERGVAGGRRGGRPLRPRDRLRRPGGGLQWGTRPVAAARTLFRRLGSSLTRPDARPPRPPCPAERGQRRGGRVQGGAAGGWRTGPPARVAGRPFRRRPAPRIRGSSGGTGTANAASANPAPRTDRQPPPLPTLTPDDPRSRPTWRCLRAGWRTASCPGRRGRTWRSWSGSTSRAPPWTGPGPGSSAPSTPAWTPATSARRTASTPPASAAASRRPRPPPPRACGRRPRRKARRRSGTR